MTDNTFRTFCAFTIAVMFGLILWMALQERDDIKGIQIKSPWFEYKGEERDAKQDIHIESPWFEYKGEQIKSKKSL